MSYSFYDTVEGNNKASTYCTHFLRLLVGLFLKESFKSNFFKKFF